MSNIDDYDETESYPEFHAAVTITFGELLEAGLNLDWQDDAYDKQQYSRVNRKIENRYYDREIGVLPVSRFVRHFKRIISETMPTLKPLYDAVAKNQDIILSDTDTYAKNRSVYSDYPATQLKSNQDYASNATDNESEVITNGSFMSKAQAIRDNEYVDIDIILLDKLSEVFSPLWTVNINNY